MLLDRQDVGEVGSEFDPEPEDEVALRNVEQHDAFVEMSADESLAPDQ